jgi:DNA (cytosine-5)-methyltransferase 1
MSYTMKFVSLFAGVGGLDLGLELEGHDPVYQVEIDPFCQAVLRKHWPGVPKDTDVRRVTDLPRPFDAIVGGDPCQAHANACRNAPPIQESYADEFLRLVKINFPRFVVRENPSVVRKDIKYDWRGFCAGLEALGYYAVPIEAAACCAGAEHIRKRMFVFAAIQDTDIKRLEGYERGILACQAKNGPVSESFDIAGSARWNSAPRVCRAADGIPLWVDRLRTLGNAVSPVQGRWVGKVLTRLAEERN